MSQSSTNVIRPTGAPFYWLFDADETAYMNMHVGQLAADGTKVTIKLKEQDDPGVPDDTIGSFALNVNPDGSIGMTDQVKATYAGKNSPQGWRRYQLSGLNADYIVYLSIAD